MYIFQYSVDTVCSLMSQISASIYIIYLQNSSIDITEYSNASEY